MRSLSLLKIKSYPILKVSFLSGFGTICKILTSIISLKIVALYTGPSGVGVLGQFMTVFTVYSIISGGGINLGVIKYVAEYSTTSFLKDFLASAVSFTLFFSISTLLLGYFFSYQISFWVLGTMEFEYLFRILAVSQIFLSFHTLFCSIINGFEKIRLLVLVNVLSSLFNMAIVIAGAVAFALKGTLVAFVIAQGFAVIISFTYIYREFWFKYLLNLSTQIKYWKNLSRYSLMNILSALTVPISQIIVRNDLNLLYGWEKVGYWQAVVRLSDAYLLFVTTALTSYYLPRLSKLIVLEEIKREIFQSYKVWLPFLAFVLLLLYIFRKLVVSILYNSAFLPATDLFFYQLLGDFFRIAGWLFTYLLLAKSWTKTYILTEFILSFLFIVFSHYFVRLFGLVGVTYSFAITYFFYWIMMVGIGLHFFKGDREKCQLMSIP